MSRKNLQNEPNIFDLFDRLKNIMNLQKDSELANLLNIKQSTLSTYKSRKKIPYDKIFSICENENINFHWLMTGKGQISTIKNLDSNNDNSESISPFIIKILKKYPTIEKFIKLLSMLDNDSLIDFEILLKKTIKHKKEILEVKNRLSELESKIEVK